MYKWSRRLHPNSYTWKSKEHLQTTHRRWLLAIINHWFTTFHHYFKTHCTNIHLQPPTTNHHWTIDHHTRKSPITGQAPSRRRTHRRQPWHRIAERLLEAFELPRGAQLLWSALGHVPRWWSRWSPGSQQCPAWSAWSAWSTAADSSDLVELDATNGWLVDS